MELPVSREPVNRGNSRNILLKPIRIGEIGISSTGCFTNTGDPVYQLKKGGITRKRGIIVE